MAVACFTAAAAQAQAQAPQAPREKASATACRFESAGGGKVLRVLDGRSFLLEDGREIRLAAIEVAATPRPGETGTRAEAGAAAMAALQTMLLGRAVELSQARPAIDRYGRTLAYVDVIIDGTARPVASAMVAGGHARVAAQVETTGCAVELLSRERTARAGKLGLWGNPYYGILGAESRAELLAGQGHFTVVEGKVSSVRESGGTIYVNFGRRWSEALTVTISKRHERMFMAAGISPKALENRRVRVRGYVDERNGPRIEATRPEQIEIAELN